MGRGWRVGGGQGGADGALGVGGGGGGEGGVEVVFDRVVEGGREGVAAEVLEVVAAGEGDAFAWRGRQLDDPGEAEFEWEGDVRAVVFGEGSDFFPGEVEQFGMEGEEVDGGEFRACVGIRGDEDSGPPLESDLDFCGFFLPYDLDFASYQVTACVYSARVCCRIEMDLHWSMLKPFQMIQGVN